MIAHVESLLPAPKSERGILHTRVINDSRQRKSRSLRRVWIETEREFQQGRV